MFFRPKTEFAISISFEEEGLEQCLSVSKKVNLKGISKLSVKD